MEVPLSFKQSQEETAFSSNIYPTCNMMVALADPQVNILLWLHLHKKNELSEIWLGFQSKSSVRKPISFSIIY